MVFEENPINFYSFRNIISYRMNLNYKSLPTRFSPFNRRKLFNF